MARPSFVLRLSCENRPGIVLAVSRFLFDAGCDILDAQQFDDRYSGRFFARFVFRPVKDGPTQESLGAAFAEVAVTWRMSWRLRPEAQSCKVLILVSRFEHCLADLLYRWRTGELPIDIVGVVANHPRETYVHLDFGDVPFHFLPVSPETRPAQEAEIRAIADQTGAELIVLARYMQVLSDEAAAAFAGRCINIHHGFLPGFKGARPYHQAHARGVKLIGATAHYVTADLDEGPIIEQHVERISHRDGPDDMIRKGRDIERRVLARAVRLHIEDRVLLNGATTVVFPE